MHISKPNVMSIRIFLLVIVAFLLQGVSYPGNDSNVVNFIPLNIGNEFIYQYHNSNFDTINIKVSIDRDTILNNRRYFLIQNSPWGTGFFRVDTISKSFYRYDSSNSCNNYYFFEMLVDSLASLPQGWGRCSRGIMSSSIYSWSVFGIQTYKLRVGVFANQYYSNFKNYYLDFGLGEYYSHGPTYINHWMLQGCVINGIVFGDTVMHNTTGLTILGNNIPINYLLSQNYPNPFNPQTKIKFAVPSNVKGQTSNVKLIIYDLLGREVTTLVNEKLKPGTYEADWDASSYSSGVYFYKLLSVDFVETRKMVLMK
jgi:hypothetical protein